MYEKPTAGTQHLETKHERDALVKQRLPISHCCEDICGQAEHNPKIFQV